MRWTGFRLLASHDAWFSNSLDHDGPAVYELAIGGPAGGDMRIVYVGETANERARLASYGRDGSPLSEIIWWHLKQGWHLYYRAVAMPSKALAAAIAESTPVRVRLRLEPRRRMKCRRPKYDTPAD